MRFSARTFEDAAEETSNNDRYVFINVDSHPEPMKEFPRLLDIRMSFNRR